MKPRIGLSLVVMVLFGSVLVRADEPAKPASPPPAGTMKIVDLRANLSGFFYYGTWDENVTAAKDGQMVIGAKGAQGSGGFGRNLEPALDLGAATYIEVALGVLPDNEVPAVMIALNDADGTQVSARVQIDQLVPGTPVWLRARREDFKPNGGEPGTNPAMDWSTVARWHLQGDWNTKKPCSLIFIALRARK
jgi:hypothetical protein